MKKIALVSTVFLVLLSLLAFRSVKQINDILKELQMEKDEVKESIFGDFQDGVLDFPYSEVVTKFALARRSAAVKEIGDYIKAYTESNEFAVKYKEARDAARPQASSSIEEKIKERLNQIGHDIETNEEGLKKANTDMKKLYEASLLELKKEKKALTNSSDPQHDYYVTEITKTSDGEARQAMEDLKWWQENYPPTARELVKKRLLEFLDLTKDIDFNAKLVRRGSLMIFADPNLEQKSMEWKRCFRCGRETITAARTYAQQWLASLK